MPEPIIVDGVQVGERLFVAEVTGETPYSGDTSKQTPDIVGGTAGLHDGSRDTYVHTWFQLSPLASAGAQLRLEKATAPITAETLTRVVLHIETANTNSEPTLSGEYSWALYNWIPGVPWGDSGLGTSRLWGNHLTAHLYGSSALVSADGTELTDDWGLLGPAWNGSVDEAWVASTLAPLFSPDGPYDAGFAVAPLAGTLGTGTFTDADTYLHEFWVDVYYEAPPPVIEDAVYEVPIQRQVPRSDSLGPMRAHRVAPVTRASQTSQRVGGPDLVQAEDGSWVPRSFYDDTAPHFQQGGMVRAEDGTMVPRSFYDDNMVRAEDGSLVPKSFYWGRTDGMVRAEDGTLVPRSFYFKQRLYKAEDGTYVPAGYW